MAPRTPVDIDNPSWGDWIKGNIKYGERKAADFNDWWATRTTNDQLPDREVFLDQIRNDPRANGLEAFLSGARYNMDRGGFFAPAFKSVAMPDPASPEAMRKMDYAYGQKYPIPHLVGTGVGTTIAVADAIASGAAANKVYNLGKAGLGWVGGRLGLGSAVEAGPIGAWTNASTGARAAPSAAAQAASWLGNTGRSAGSAVASKLPVTTALVTKGGPFAAATAASALGVNALINYIDGVPAQHEAAREKQAAAEQAAAEKAAAQTQANQPKNDWYDQMAAIGGVDRDTIKAIVQQEGGGIRMSTLQALNGMKGRPTAVKDRAYSALGDIMQQQIAQALESGDTKRAQELSNKYVGIVAQVASGDEMLASALENLLNGEDNGQ